MKMRTATGEKKKQNEMKKKKLKKKTAIGRSINPKKRIFYI